MEKEKKKKNNKEEETINENVEIVDSKQKEELDK